MNRATFNTNQITIKNNCFFGLPTTIEDAKVVFLSVPWDATVSYGEGTANGPQGILDASYQLDWYDFDLPLAWEVGYSTLPISAEIRAKSEKTRAIAKKVIDHLESGNELNDKAIAKKLEKVNQASTNLNDWVYAQCKNLLLQGKLIGLVGGDHSVPLGYIKALTEDSEYSILHIDAHADLREAYEGFTYSHASIMNNVLLLPNISKLVQVGIRDLCQEEINKIKSDNRIVLFDDWQLKNNLYEGLTWQQQCETIISNLSEKVYISFDVDGLNQAFCPNTGTPVPGGLDFNQAIYLVQTLVKSGKKIIGFDLCEVAPSKSDEEQWDGNIGARLLYKLTNLMYLSQSS
ncbi:MAG: agmatinase family protein [Gomphosphaeria aponina SAG 52.96 = DSM 107014]|uniref:Agmatinase family protein n=1 Tax=Gomphosphaeria aponina SAG 52.96 = DSM 107014 TaxID=1521640 RepID=A0A941GRU4_9CHRO|nr:agmatinase family protein [Gomphosphaeria aponina SAG 52.96 = DSM 107014]